MTKPREEWSSRLGVILAVAGSAVGLGNFLRFPGNAAQNGGGAFMIPYFIALLVLGIPICWLEWAMARRGGLAGYNSCPGVFGVIWRHRASKYFGSLGLLIPLVIYMYYVYVEGWCLGYCYLYLAMPGSFAACGRDPAQFSAYFREFVGQNSDGLMFDGRPHISVIFWLIVFTINFLLIYRGLSKGIESFCKYAMPAMAVCAIIVLIRVLTLGTPDPSKPDQNVINGLGFMWNPDMEKLKDFNTWLAAAGQIFFSLSVGFGVIINYASYLKRNDDLVLSGLTATSTNEFFEVCLGGLITIPAAFVFLGATGIAGSINSTFSLGFHTLPVVFAYMPFGRLFGFLWFFMLFLAAITSSLSMLQPVAAFIEEAFSIGRHAAVVILGTLTGAGGLFVIYFSNGLKAVDAIDFWVGTLAIFVLSMIQVFIFIFAYGVDRGLADAHDGAHIRIPRVFYFVIKYVTPTYLIVIFVGWCTQAMPVRVFGEPLYQLVPALQPLWARVFGSAPPVDKVPALIDGGVELYSVIMIVAAMAILLGMIFLAGKHWKRFGPEPTQIPLPGGFPTAQMERRAR
ncbi:MAG: sodium-dependent transporter [Phycisphaerae bacterium]|nr:sodium-dependent transporter [Phycisphaerae bacterium]